MDRKIKLHFNVKQVKRKKNKKYYNCKKENYYLGLKDYLTGWQTHKNLQISTNVIPIC